MKKKGVYVAVCVHLSVSAQLKGSACLSLYPMAAAVYFIVPWGLPEVGPGVKPLSLAHSQEMSNPFTQRSDMGATHCYP